MGQSTIECDIIELAKLTLSKNPNIDRSELQIKNAEANFQIQQSQFDFNLSSGITSSLTRSALFNEDSRNTLLNDNLFESRRTTFSAGLTRQFRSGTTTDLSLNYTKNADNFPINQFNQNVGKFTADYDLVTTLSITQPLLKGRGKKVATALEKSSSLLVENAQYNFDFINSFELLEYSIAYWGYVNAFKNLIIFKENEKRIDNVLRITNELVKADKKPKGDLAQIKADLADKQRQTEVAIQNLYNSKLNLGRIIGLSDIESESLGIPQNDFPTISDSKFNKAINAKLAIDKAEMLRSDIKAEAIKSKAFAIQLDLAANNLKPQLDLTSFISYGGENMGKGINPALTTLTNDEGRNYAFGLGLNFIFPINNNFAKGTFLQSKSAFLDQNIVYENLKRNINLSVHIALNNLKKSVLILKRAKESLNYYKDVYANEQIKFQNGLTTLLNLILFQERLTFAQIEHINAQQQFAIAIVNLRFQTGTLIPIDKNSSLSAITKDIYYSVPDFTN